MFLMMLVCWLYLVLTVIAPAPVGMGWKLVLGVLALGMSAKLKLNALVGTDWFSSPDGLPRPLLYGLVFLYGFGVIFLCLNVLADVLQMLPATWGLWLHQFNVKEWIIWRARTHACLAVLTAILTVWGLYQGQRPPQVSRLDVHIPELSPQAEGLTLALLADIHADPYFGKNHVRDMVEVANGTHADFMLLLGDYVDGQPHRREEFLQDIKDLKPRIATLGIAGNHEYYSDYVAWRPTLERWGVRMLDNAHADFPAQGISLIGVTDPEAVRHGLPGPDVRQAVRGRQAGLSGIAMVHRPGLVEQWEAVAADLRPALQVSGHTHGGMLPVLRVLLGCFNGGYYAGFHDDACVPLYVSRGAGIWNGFPLRVFCPAEITLISLHGKRG